jgi:hypothetical protein
MKDDALSKSKKDDDAEKPDRNNDIEEETTQDHSMFDIV